MATGTVVRFDEVRGYGFIAPDSGGEDVFVHVNDLRDDKHLFDSGLRVEYTTEAGERGLKASDVRLLGPARPASARRQGPVGGGPERMGSAESDDDLMCDVLSHAEFRNELTEALLDAAPSLTAAQLVQVRRRVMELVQAHNWTEA